MPSSSDAVATTALRSPFLSRCSITCRRSLDSEPWVSGDVLLADADAELMRDPLGQRASVDKDQRRPVLEDQFRQPVVNRAPMFVGGKRLQRRVGRLNPELQLAPMP